MLKNYLKSPLFYFLAVLFLIFVSLNFFVKQQFFGVTGSTDLVLFFSAVPYICILIIPALCYPHSFFIYDSFIPQTHESKVLKRFFYLLIQYLILCCFLIPPVLCINIFGSVDGGQFFTGFLCLVVYGCAAISVTLLIYEIITLPVGAFLISAVILAIINSSHLGAVYISLNSFLTALCKSLSFVWHFDAAGKGILDTRDFIWFLSITAIFLLITYLVSEKKLGKILNGKKIRYNICLLLICILVLLNGQRYYKRLDLSKGRIYSLSSYSKRLASTFEDSLKITYYRSNNLLKLYPQIRDVTDFLMTYSDSSSRISLLIKDTDKDSQAAATLQNYGISSQPIRTIKNNSTEYLQVYSAIIIEYNGNIETIPFVTSAQSLEYDLDGRINHLVGQKERTVNIVIGNGMNLYSDFSYLVNWLSSQGFICNQISIDDPEFSHKLDTAKGPLLVIGDSEIKIDQAIAIESFILNKEGKAFFAVSPFSVNIENDWSLVKNQRTNLIEMLENLGIKFSDSIGADVLCSRITMYSDDNQTKILNYPFWISLMPQMDCKAGMTLFWPDIMEFDDSVEPILWSSPSAYICNISSKDNPLISTNQNSLIETNPFELQNRSTEGLKKQSVALGARIKGEIKGLYTLGLQKNADIYVIPDPYFLSNLMTQYNGGEYGDYRNFDYLTGSLLRLNGEEELAELNGKANRDISLYKIDDEQHFQLMKKFTFVILMGIIPFIILCIPVILIIREKNYVKK